MLPLERVGQALIYSLYDLLLQYSNPNESDKSFQATNGSDDTTESNEKLFFATGNTHNMKPHNHFIYSRCFGSEIYQGLAQQRQLFFFVCH
jgi:hypothetical protein